MEIFRRDTVTPSNDPPVSGLRFRTAATIDVILRIDELLKRADYLEKHAPGLVDALLDHRNRLSTNDPGIPHRTQAEP